MPRNKNNSRPRGSSSAASSRRSRKANQSERKMVFIGPIQQKQNRSKPRPSQTRMTAAPVSISRGTTVVSNNIKTMSYRRREFVTELRSMPATANGTVLKLALNPGMATTFPWLSTVSAFEQYRFKNISFTFNSSTSTSERGQIIMVTNVDAKDPVMTTSAELMSYSGACIGRVWDTHTHKVPAQAVTKKNYVRTGTPPVNADLSLYDVGLFYFHTLGVQPNMNIGTLWVEYDVEFFTPKFTPSARLLEIRGDSKSVKTNEPLGNEGLWKINGNSSVDWHCPDDDPTKCTFVIQPNGQDAFQLNLATLLGVDSDGKTVSPFGTLLGDNFEIINETRTYSPGYNAGHTETDMTNFSVLGNIIDKALPLIFKVGWGNINPPAEFTGDATPMMVLNMFKQQAGFLS